MLAYTDVVWAGIRAIKTFGKTLPQHPAQETRIKTRVNQTRCSKEDLPGDEKAKKRGWKKTSCGYPGGISLNKVPLFGQYNPLSILALET